MVSTVCGVSISRVYYIDRSACDNYSEIYVCDADCSQWAFDTLLMCVWQVVLSANRLVSDANKFKEKFTECQEMLKQLQTNPESG